MTNAGENYLQLATEKEKRFKSVKCLEFDYGFYLEQKWKTFEVIRRGNSET